MERKRGLNLLLIIFIFLSVLIILSIFTSILSQSNSTIYQGNVIKKNYLEDLKIKANIECLQNSQCLGVFECVDNYCVSNKEINVCQKIKLSTNSIPLEIGKPINLAKKVLTRKDLPYLLSDGEIVEIKDGNLTEHFYSPVILVGENNIEKENKDYFININNKPIYTYRLMFSTGVDFSNKNIHWQILRILGREYIIGDNSDNSIIELISDNKKLKLEDGKKVNEIAIETLVNIKRNEEGKVIMLEISFNNLGLDDKLKVRESYTDSVFNAIKLSFDYADDGFADIRVGGNC